MIRKLSSLGVTIVLGGLLVIAACGGDVNEAGTDGGAGGSASNADAAGAGGEGGNDGSSAAKGGAAGAGGSADDGTTPTFASVQAILARNCAACHSGRTRPNLSTTNATLYATLTTTTVANCGGQELVVPGNPDQSALVGVIEGSGGCTIRMPEGCPTRRACLSATEIQTIRDWIAAGAPGP